MPSEVQQLRLRALAKFLREIAKAEHFGMATFLTTSEDRFSFLRPHETRAKINVCGTVACALGHAPVLFPELITNQSNWGTLAEELFGLPCDEGDELNAPWVFLFGGNWADVDNTKEGAAARIEYFLEHGAPNYDDCLAMQTGRKELCYDRA